MRVFIGGAFNGKREYVRKLLKAEGRNGIQWVEGGLPSPGKEPVVIAGIERWLAECSLSEERAIDQVMEIVRSRDVVFILTDIGRGIVPVEKGQRALRDICGRLYQQLLAEADEVTRIWYGIAQTLKRGDQDENLYENGR